MSRPGLSLLDTVVSVIFPPVSTGYKVITFHDYTVWDSDIAISSKHISNVLLRWTIFPLCFHAERLLVKIT